MLLLFRFSLISLLSSNATTTLAIYGACVPLPFTLWYDPSLSAHVIGRMVCPSKKEVPRLKIRLSPNRSRLFSFATKIRLLEAARSRTTYE